MAQRPPPALHLPPEDLEGVSEDTWLDVIHKMEEVYSKLVTDEVELEEKTPSWNSRNSSSSACCRA